MMRRVIFIAIPVFIAALLALFVVSRNGVPSGDNDLSAPDTSSGTPPLPNRNSGNTNSTASEDLSRAQVTTVSRMFSERYASTSSQSPNTNLISALPYASSSLKAAFERTMAGATVPTGDNVTTASRAMAFSILYVDDRIGRAGVTVSLQRVERRGTAAAKTYTQDLSLQLIRQGPDWKVNVAVFATI